MNPATFLRVLGPEPWSVAYAEPSVRPDDSRYGDNPNRLQRHTQFQARTHGRKRGGCSLACFSTAAQGCGGTFASPRLALAYAYRSSPNVTQPLSCCWCLYFGCVAAGRPLCFR